MRSLFACNTAITSTANHCQKINSPFSNKLTPAVYVVYSNKIPYHSVTSSHCIFLLFSVISTIRYWFTKSAYFFAFPMREICIHKGLYALRVKWFMQYGHTIFGIMLPSYFHFLQLLIHCCKFSAPAIFNTFILILPRLCILPVFKHKLLLIIFSLYFVPLFDNILWIFNLQKSK